MASLSRSLQLGDLLAVVRADHVQRLEAVVDVHPEPRPGLALVLGRHVGRVARQVPDVTDARLDHVPVAQVAGDHPRLPRRLDDHQPETVLAGRAGSPATGWRRGGVGVDRGHGAPGLRRARVVRAAGTPRAQCAGSPVHPVKPTERSISSRRSRLPTSHPYHLRAESEGSAAASASSSRTADRWVDRLRSPSAGRLQSAPTGRSPAAATASPLRRRTARTRPPTVVPLSVPPAPARPGSAPGCP